MSATPTLWPQPSIIIWVSPNGSDTIGNGTTLHPYKTIEYALYNFTEGNQIRLMDGIYTPANSIVIDGISGSIFAENPNEVTIKPLLATIDNACISIKNVERFSISGVNIVQPDDSTDNYAGVYANNVNNLVVYSCNVYNFDFPLTQIGYGIFASGTGRIERCYVYNVTGGEIYGIKTTGLDIVDCEAAVLSGVSVTGIAGDNK